MNDKTRADRCADESEHAADLEQILAWACLTACRVRKNAAGIEKYRKILEARGETDWRLQESGGWRESTAFTEREKAALSLSESMSSGPSEEPLRDVLKVAKQHFDREEMIRLTLNILAVNDWIGRHSSDGVHILVVEDNPLDQDLLRRQLQKAQMEGNVIFVSDAHQAMAVLEDYRNGQRKEELIALFLDINLPGMSGIELLRRIRVMPEMEDLPVIVMTGSNDPQDMEECQKLSVVSYVEKPVTVGSFSRAIANIFHRT